MRRDHAIRDFYRGVAAVLVIGGILTLLGYGKKRHGIGHPAKVIRLSTKPDAGFEPTA
jgi:hypothetical protein